MQVKQKQSFFMSSQTDDNQTPHSQSSSFIFDETYKTKFDKHKFEHNPKFAYFNTVMRIRNKLFNHHEVYSMLFDPESINEEHKWKNLSIQHRKINTSAVPQKSAQDSQTNKEFNQTSQDFKEGRPLPTPRKSVKQINFQSTKIHKRRQSELYYDRKPRLDDILAEYRKMNKKEKDKNKSFYVSQKKKVTQQFQLFNRTGRLLPRQFSQPQKPKKVFN